MFYLLTESLIDEKDNDGLTSIDCAEEQNATSKMLYLFRVILILMKLIYLNELRPKPDMNVVLFVLYKRKLGSIKQNVRLFNVLRIIFIINYF